MKNLIQLGMINFDGSTVMILCLMGMCAFLITWMLGIHDNKNADSIPLSKLTDGEQSLINRLAERTEPGSAFCKTMVIKPKPNRKGIEVEFVGASEHNFTWGSATESMELIAEATRNFLQKGWRIDFDVDSGILQATSNVENFAAHKNAQRPSKRRFAG
jgi:hypothetical protein